MKYKFVGKSLSKRKPRERDQPNFRFVGKALWFPMEKILVISDLHIGYEEALGKQGIFVAREQLKETIGDLKKVFLKTGEVEEIIILGDLKHEFGSISQQEWKDTLEVLDFLKGKGKKIILIKGNHDKILGPIADRRNLDIRNFYIKNGKAFIHGDKLFPEVLDKKVKLLVMGHKHPAARIADKYKEETFKCFLVGKWKKKEAIILPSFFPLVEGTSLDEENNIPFISGKELGNFEVHVPMEGEVYDFGKMKNLEN